MKLVDTPPPPTREEILTWFAALDIEGVPISTTYATPHMKRGWLQATEPGYAEWNLDVMRADKYTSDKTLEALYWEIRLNADNLKSEA